MWTPRSKINDRKSEERDRNKGETIIAYKLNTSYSDRKATLATTSETISFMIIETAITYVTIQPLICNCTYFVHTFFLRIMGQSLEIRGAYIFGRNSE